MSGEELQVDPQDLHAKAAQIEALSWSSQAAQPPLISADALVIASVAITNLRVNADGLWARQAYGQKEGERLAQTLRNVGDAYAQIDQISGEDIDSTIDGPAPAGPGASVYPKPVDIPAPVSPDAMPIPKGQLASDQGFMDVNAAEVALDSGDDGESLRAAAAMWRANGQSLATSAEAFEVNSVDWEGEAADAAYAKFNAYRDWLISLAEAWKNLADEADRIVGEHDKARAAHQPIAVEYQQLEQQTMGKPLTPEVMRNLERMAELQASSEEIRTSYAAGATTRQFEPDDPPSPVVSGTPVTADDHRRARKRAAEADADAARQAAAGGGGGGQPGGGQAPPEGMPQEAPVSPMSATEQAGQAASQGASQGGGSPGGGQGGAPSGGAPGGAPSGMPGLGKGDPKLPADPSLRPAAAGGGGGSGGGAGGGGMPSSPLQPAVGAETVAPTPVTAPSPSAAAAAGGTTGGGMAGGGMGGMAPMMGAARGGEGGDKKRNPLLSEDEEIYTEERPHTEPVIGHRPRRRGSDDSKRESQ